jgi:nucleoside-diphosphate-sugar epimerase
VTGACGYTGRALLSWLLHHTDHYVYALDLDGVDFGTLPSGIKGYYSMPYEGDMEIAAESCMQDSAAEVLIHLAALIRPPKDNLINSYLRSNIELGCQLVAAGLQANLSYLVNTGSFWEETDGAGQYSPVDFYAASKRAFQDFIAYYSKHSRLRSITIRPFGIFGPNDSRQNLFSYLDQHINSSTPVKLTPGKQIFELIYLDDLLYAYHLAVEALQKTKAATVLPSVEISTGEGLTLRKVIGLYEKTRASNMPIIWGGIPYRENEVMDRYANLRPAKQVLGWEPQTDIYTGFCRIYGKGEKL